MSEINVSMVDLYEQDDFGNTPLHLAFQEKNPQKAQKLLNIISKSGDTDVLNIQNNRGDTPLHVCVRKLPLNNIANMMIALGADQYIKNKKGEIVEIAETLNEFFANSKYTLDFTPKESDLDFPSLTIVDLLPKKESEKQSSEFPSEVTIEDVPKPSLVDSGKEDNKDIEMFIENLLKSKKVN